MKLTLKQISKLSDTELNRAMIWRYPTSHKITYTDQSGLLKYYIERKWQLESINYLSDYNLTMPLAHDNGLMVDFLGCTTEVDHLDITFPIVNKNPLRAICEVLVMIAVESDK